MFLRLSTKAFGTSFLCVLRESGPGSRGRLAVRTWKSGHFFHEPLVSDSLAPLRQSTEVWKKFKIFHVNANSDPEVHDGGGGFFFCLFFLKGRFSDSVQLSAHFLGALDGQQLLVIEGSGG